MRIQAPIALQFVCCVCEPMCLSDCTDSLLARRVSLNGTTGEVLEGALPTKEPELSSGNLVTLMVRLWGAFVEPLCSG